jgi:hypothetical protein
VGVYSYENREGKKKLREWGREQLSEWSRVQLRNVVGSG